MRRPRKIPVEYMTFFINEAKKRGATLGSGPPRSAAAVQDGKAVSTLGEYPDITRSLAKENGIALVDLNSCHHQKMNTTKLGAEECKKLFNYVKIPVNPHTGTTADRKKEKRRSQDARAACG